MNYNDDLIFRVIRIKRVSFDKPAGISFYFFGTIERASRDVCEFLWGKDLKNYLVIKLGTELELPSNDLTEIEKFLITA